MQMVAAAALLSLAAALLAYSLLSERGRWGDVYSKLERDSLWLLPALYILGAAGYSFNSALNLLLRCCTRHVRSIHVMLTAILARARMAGQRLSDAIGEFGDRAQGKPVLHRVIRGMMAMAEERGSLAQQVVDTWAAAVAAMREEALENARRVETAASLTMTTIILLELMVNIMLLISPEMMAAEAAVDFNRRLKATS